MTKEEFELKREISKAKKKRGYNRRKNKYEELVNTGNLYNWNGKVKFDMKTYKKKMSDYFLLTFLLLSIGTAIVCGNIFKQTSNSFIGSLIIVLTSLLICFLLTNVIHEKTHLLAESEKVK